MTTQLAFVLMVTGFVSWPVMGESVAAIFPRPKPR